MERVRITLNAKGLQPILPSGMYCLRIRGAEVKRGLLHIIIETPYESDTPTVLVKGNLKEVK